MPPISYAFIVSSFLLLSHGLATEIAVPIKRVVPTEAQLQPETNFYDVFIMGKKVGWMKESLARTKFEGADVYAVEVEYLQKILNGEEALTLASVDTEYFSAEPPYQLVAATSKSAQNGFEASTELRRSQRGENEFVARMVGGDSEREKEIGILDYALGDPLAGVAWCEGEPEVGDAIRIRELDLVDLEVTAGLNTIKKILPAEGDGAVVVGGRSGKYEIEYFDEVDKMRANFTTDARGKLLKGKVSGAVTLVLNTEEEAKKLEANIDLFESSLIKIGQRLGDASDIRELVLEITGPGAGAIGDGPDQDATFDAEAGRVLLKVGREHGVKVPVSAEARAEALEETSVYPTKDPEVIALVEKAIGRATRPKARIKRLVDFVDTFIIDDYGNEPLTVNDIIDTQLGDCSEHSQLFVTMARAAGIPARLVSGFIYGEGADSSFGGHAWCEVEVDGHWHPVDPTWGETMINATHIRISGERPSSEELDLYMGGLKFRILSATDHKGRRREFAKPAGE